MGQGDFYLKISNQYNTEYDLTDATIETKCVYDKIYKTTATLWLANEQEQPVIKVEKEEVLEGKININIMAY